MKKKGARKSICRQKVQFIQFETKNNKQKGIKEDNEEDWITSAQLKSASF